MDTRKERLISAIGTGVFHLLIVVFLLLVYLKPALVRDEESSLGGIPVMFGNVPEAGGDDEPFGRGSGYVADNTSPKPNAADVTTAEPASDPLPAGDNTIATQDMDETIAIKAEADKKAAEEKARLEAIAAEERRKKEEADRIAREQAAKGQQIGNQVAGLFGNGDGQGSRGDSEGEGTQGVETGNASFGEKSGIGGVGGGFKLGNRKLGAGGLIRPAYNVNAEGRVIVNIRVNAKGRVVEATVGQGTTASNPTLLKEALKAAERTRFNEIEVNKDEIGTITYTFTLN
ncbi:cell envelope integrity protein TolA [Dysgonomonas sp. 25]|uniref:cell envelope integrity protein TolA n=1 Tax=Dysgonomonas sp. 25 TaxID=2302933 RepID=UPI0013D73B94|nr:cell envelope integrity protein TolA [Dysgonomonas sp. 25]NDV70319.1 TonB family protein [Dysgonomonas sp. 25]